jgi:hypothetical protein
MRPFPRAWSFKRLAAWQLPNGEFKVMEWKIKSTGRIGLLAGAAVIALMSGQPAFAGPSTNTQTTTQTGTNDNETQVQQAGTTNSLQVIYQSTTNADGAGVQIYQNQVAGDFNREYAGQADKPVTPAVFAHAHTPPVTTGGNLINQTQYSSDNKAVAYQIGQKNTIVQVQSGNGSNSAYVGTFTAAVAPVYHPAVPGEGGEGGGGTPAYTTPGTPAHFNGGQYGKSNFVGQYQTGSNEVVYAGQHGNNDIIRQTQDFVGTGVGEGSSTYQHGSEDTMTQNQYSDATQNARQRGFGNTATQTQGYGSRGAYQGLYQNGEYNIASQTQSYNTSFGYQHAHQAGNHNSATQTRTAGGGEGGGQYISQFGNYNVATQTIGAGSYGGVERLYQNGDGNTAVQIQSHGSQYSSIDQSGGEGKSGNYAYTLQTGRAGNDAEITQGGEGYASNSKAYIVQHAKNAGEGNYASIRQYGFNNTATVDQGTASHPVAGAYALVYQGHSGTGSGVAPNYATVDQRSGTQYAVVRQLNSGIKANTADILQSGSGTGFAGIYQGGFEKGTNLLYAANPAVGVSNSIYQFTGATNSQTRSTGDVGYINQFTSSGGKSLAGIYQNVHIATATINQGMASAPVSNDIALIYQCGGASAVCSGTAPVTKPAAYGNDSATINQNATFEYAKIVQMGLGDTAEITQDAVGDVARITQTGTNDYMNLTQLGVGNNFTLTQAGTGNRVTLVQH